MELVVQLKYRGLNVTGCCKPHKVPGQCDWQGIGQLLAMTTSIIRRSDDIIVVAGPRHHPGPLRMRSAVITGEISPYTIATMILVRRRSRSFAH